MPQNWDEHYARAPALDFTPSAFLVEAAEQLPRGRVLDLACGHGRNALYLARLGWSVVAVDASPAAIRILDESASAAHLRVDTHVANLQTNEFVIEQEGYDLICDFRFLQRSLFSYVREGVRPGGAFIAEIHLRDDTAKDGPRSPDFVLEPGELRREFAEWKILFYSEATPPGQTRALARIIARRA